MSLYLLNFTKFVSIFCSLAISLSNFCFDSFFDIKSIVFIFFLPWKVFFKFFFDNINCLNNCGTVLFICDVIFNYLFLKHKQYFFNLENSLNYKNLYKYILYLQLSLLLLLVFNYLSLKYKHYFFNLANILF